MSIDVFGRQLERSQAERGPAGIGFNFTQEGQFDVENRRLCNVGDPVLVDDAINLKTFKLFLQSEIDYISAKLGGIVEIIDYYEKKLEKIQSEVNAHLKSIDDQIAHHLNRFATIIDEQKDRLTGHITYAD